MFSWPCTAIGACALAWSSAAWAALFAICDCCSALVASSNFCCVMASSPGVGIPPGIIPMPPIGIPIPSFGMPPIGIPSIGIPIPSFGIPGIG